MADVIRPRFYKSVLQYYVLQISMRKDKLGELFYYVEYTDNDNVPRHVYFAHLSSVLDFINSNFKKA